MGVRNVTPHSEFGIGQWSDAQIARAIRSGITPQGQVLFWGFMPWDMFSNFDEEDTRALVAYLRTLPPVEVDPSPRERPPPNHPMEITWKIDTARVMDLLEKASAR